MTRTACAWIPRFELVLLARREGPSLWRRPVVIADLAESPVLVREATPAAERAGVRPGMTLAQASVLCAGLAAHPPLPEARAAAEAEVLRVLAAHAPRLATDHRGAFFLGLAGMDRLIADERDYAARVRGALAALGLPARVAVAGHPFAAWIAARRDLGPVAPGGDARLLAEVPVAELDLGDQARALLELLGITVAGEIARLPRGTLARRLGPEGERLERLCRGEWLAPETRPTAAALPRDPADAALDLDSPVESLEPLLFLMKGLVDGLLDRVAGARLALAEMTIEADLDDAERTKVVHRLAPAEPTLDARTLLDLVRLWLERTPFPAPLRSVRVVASKVAPAVARQLRLYARRQDEGEAALARALARLEAAFGAGSVVRPTLAARFLPEERVAWVPARVEDLAAPGGAAEASGLRSVGAPQARRGAEPRLRRGGAEAGREPLEAAPGGAAEASGHRLGHVGGARGAESGFTPAAAADGGREPSVPATLALRLLPVPEPVELVDAGGGVRRLHRRGAPPRRVLRFEASQRRSGEWWDAPFDRSYAWAICEGGAEGEEERYWLFHDHLCGGTFLHAVAD